MTQGWAWLVVLALVGAGAVAWLAAVLADALDDTQ